MSGGGTATGTSNSIFRARQTKGAEPARLPSPPPSRQPPPPPSSRQPPPFPLPQHPAPPMPPPWPSFTAAERLRKAQE